MRKIENISNKDFICLTTKLLNDSVKSTISIIGWQDGDYFEELAQENGGISNFDIEYFKNKPLGKKLFSKVQLKNEIIRFQNSPVLVSNNGKYRYDWDLYIWIDKKLIIYNADLQFCEIHNLNLIGKLIQIGKTPSWLKERTHNNI